MKATGLTKSGAVVILIAGALAGCASVGPNYKRPAIPTTAQWLTPTEGIGSLADLEWWQLYQDPVLGDLIRTALDENKDLRVAVARVAEGRAQLAVTRAAQFPAVDAQGSYTNQRFLPIGFIFVPVTTAAYIGVPAEKNNSVAGLINFMRNMGSGVGTSIVTTLIARQSQFHQVHLVSRLAHDNPSFQAQLSELTQRLAGGGLGTYEAQRQAYARFYAMVQAQAQALAYIDTFWTLAVGAALMFGLAFVLKGNDPRAGGTVTVH